MLGADCFSIDHPLSFSTLEKYMMEALSSRQNFLLIECNLRVGNCDSSIPFLKGRRDV
jgi:hypothetical protein